MLDSMNTIIGSENSTNTVLLIGGILALVWLLAITFLVLKSLRLSQKLFGDTQQNELREILQEHLQRVGLVQSRLNEQEKRLNDLDEKSMRQISKVGVVRFNPFEDTGGNQSFVLALLDEENDGVVISSLHGRDRTRMYAKPVRAGEAVEFEFSDEESEAIRKAQVLGHKKEDT